MVKINLPFPPSTNTYYRNVNGRTLISKKGRLYKKMVARVVMMQKTSSMPLEGRLAIHVYLYPPDKRKRDLDNFGGKALLDSLVGAGVLIDDVQFDEFFVKRMPVEKGGLAVVMIKAL